MEVDLLQNVLETWGVAKEIQAEDDNEYQITPSYLALTHFFPSMLLRTKGINKLNKYCSNPVCYLSAIWNCRWKIWWMSKWVCNAYLTCFCHAKNKAHVNESLQPHTALVKPTGQLFACNRAEGEGHKSWFAHSYSQVTLHWWTVSFLLPLQQRELSSLFHGCCKCKVACYLLALAGFWWLAIN